MISTLDILYIVLSVCCIAITVMLLLVGSELLGVVRDMHSVAHDVEQLTGLVRRIASLIFPGAERVARDATDIEDRIHSFLTRTMHTGERNKREK